MIMSMYLSILGRIFLSSHEVFTQILSRLAQMNNVNEQDVFANILDVWLSKMCHVSQIEQRKLLGKTFILYFTMLNHSFYYFY